MKKDEFLNRLSGALSPLEKMERIRTVQYYRESIDDRIEEGVDEEQAVSEMEDIGTIATRTLEDAAVRGMLKKEGRPVSTALIILGFPVWLPILAALAAVLLSMYVVAWSVIISLFAVVAALGLSGVAGIFAMCLYAGTHFITALFLLGAGFICAALGIGLFFPSLALAKWLIAGTGNVTVSIWNKLFRRKGEANEKEH